MALLVLLLPTGAADVSLAPQAVDELSRLGVTSVSLARDEQTTAVVLEGWAFDPRREDAAVAALGAAEARALQPVAEMAVARNPDQGGRA